MRRKLLFFERLMYVDGQTPVNCLMTARLRGSLSHEALRQALDKVQARHPLLRATVDDRGKHPCFVFSSTPRRIPMRIVERCSDEDWRAEVAAEWKTPFRMDSEPMLRLVWVRSEEISELLLVGHHCICDGASLIAIFREILRVADRPDVVLDSYSPFVSLGDLIPEDVLSDWKMTIKASLKAALFRVFALTIKNVLSAPTGEHYLIYWKGDPETSRALSSRCRAEGTTPYAAMCVAFMEAFCQVEGSGFKNKMMCPVNIRRFVQNLDASEMFNYAPAIALALDRDTQADFWTLAKRFKQLMSRKIDRLDAFEHLIAAEHLHASVPKLVSLLLQSSGSYDFAFSNVGRLEIADTYTTFRLEEVLGVTVALPWKNSTTLVTTQFRGEIDLAFVANDRFLPHAKGLAIKEKAIEMLTRAIGVAAQFEQVGCAGSNDNGLAAREATDREAAVARVGGRSTESPGVALRNR